MRDTGKLALGLGVAAGLAMGPVGCGGGSRGEPPTLELPRDAKECIEPTPFMRAHHMELLQSWRDAVVRRDEHQYLATSGKRHLISLTGTCLGCHGDPAKFCDRCHQYAAVESFCWDCHQRKRRGT
jgi:hypothetical protein